MSSDKLISLPKHKCVTVNCLPCNKLDYEARYFAMTWKYLRLLADNNLLNGGFIDVGAHVGLWTLRLMKYYAVLDKRPVGFAIEPDCHNYSQLCFNVATYNMDLPPNMLLSNFAAWNCTESLYLVTNNNNNHAGGYSVVRTVGLHLNRPIISAIRIDEIVGDEPINFIKIDVEGAELKVLEGATSILKSNTNLLLCVEVLDQHAGRFGDSKSKLTKFLANFDLRPATKQDRKILQNEKQKSVANVFFIRGFGAGKLDEV